MRIGVVTVGDELLSGAVVDTNAAVLSRLLTDAGLEVVRHASAGDDEAEIVAAVRAVLERADGCVVSGGLGPTSDDVTREALAALAGTGLRRDVDVEARVRAWYAARGRPANPLALRQADVPAGATVLPNPTGSAPGLLVDVRGRPVAALPGVPSELAAMGPALVRLLAERAGSPPRVVRHTVRVVLLGESEVAERVAAVPVPEEVRVSYLASPGLVALSYAARGPAADAVAACARAARERLGAAALDEVDDTVAGGCLRALTARGESVAVAESLTGGALAAALVDVPGASAALRGGVLAYATDLKADLLGVDPDLLARSGAVDPEVAAAMARGARERLGADWGVATTGVAGPDPQDGRLPGTVHIAVVGPAGPVRTASPRLSGDRARVRALATVWALDTLRRAVVGAPAYAAESSH